MRYPCNLMCVWQTLWEKAKTLTAAGLDAITDKHDALASLELLDRHA